MSSKRRRGGSGKVIEGKGWEDDNEDDNDDDYDDEVDDDDDDEEEEEEDDEFTATSKISFDDSIAKRAKKRADNLNEPSNKATKKLKVGRKRSSQSWKATTTTATAAEEESSSQLQVQEEEVDEIAQFKDFGDLALKSDHDRRPIWVCPDGHLFLEASSPIYAQAYDFLVAIAEPVCRPEFVHEYRLTPYSLYAAVAVAIDTESIINVLRRLSKVKVPASVETFIRECTVRYGKAKLVLKQNKYYVESPYPDVLRELLKNDVIASARINEGQEEALEGFGKVSGPGGAGLLAAAAAAVVAGTTAPMEFTVSEAPQEIVENMGFQELAKQEGEEDDDDLDADVIQGTQPGQKLQNVSFRVRNDMVEEVKKAAIIIDYPLMEEYDFRHDTVNPNVKMDLKANTKIRLYQEKSLSKMFGNGRARSGIVVLPCGAGKTLTGVTAASTIKKSCICLCTSGVSVLQWKAQFQLWTDIPEKQICCFTSDMKTPLPDGACVLITTYTMISYRGKRSLEAQRIIDGIQGREWGLMLLDEVHVVPAKMFRKVLSVVDAHCKLGLTATLVREDDLISDLNFLIGPKLYEANWMDLTQAGYLANVQCVEAWCPMTAEFYAEYLKEGASPRWKELLYVMNPNKFRTAEFLVNFHLQRGDKIILFADNVFALKVYSQLLKIPFIYGDTPHNERERILATFRLPYHHGLSCIGLSKVGDTSIDIPEANVIIQVSSHFGSRRQEAQRLGRILRPKTNSDVADGFNAFFYTLVSTDTTEMHFSAKRQQYLVDQGYTYKVVTDLVEHAAGSANRGALRDKKAEMDLLREMMDADYGSLAKEEDEALGRQDVDKIDEPLDYVPPGGAKKAGGSKVRRRAGNMGVLSGGEGSRYLEFSTGGGSGGGGGRGGKVKATAKVSQVKHHLFKRRYLKIAPPTT